LLLVLGEMKNLAPTRA